MVVLCEMKENWGKMSLCIGFDRIYYDKFKRSWMVNIVVESVNCRG